MRLANIHAVTLRVRQLNVRLFLHTYEKAHASLLECVHYDHKSVISQHQQNFDAVSFYTCLISSSTHVFHLKQIHAQLKVSGFHIIDSVVSKFFNGVLNFGEMGYARKVMDEMPQPNVFMWNNMIEEFCKCGMFVDTVDMYVRMQQAGVGPNGFTLTKVLKGCSKVPLLEIGRAVHGQICRLGFEDDLFVQNGLIAFYAKCGCIDDAKNVFDDLYCTTIVSWTAIISGYVQNGQAMEALSLFSQMKMIGTKPDQITLVSVLRACTDLEYLEEGKSLHGCVIKMGLEVEEDLQISLIAMYAKCGQVTVARYLLDQISKPNVILWNAMISGCAKNGYAEEAVELFKNMATKKIKADAITLRGAILACAHIGSLDLSRWMHEYVDKSDFRDNIFVKTALIDMYAKCGCVELAKQVFDGILDKDVVAWSAMIMGYGLHGFGREAINLYYSMLQARVRPNDVTFLGLLTCCKNSGLVKEGWDLFHSMKDYGVAPLHQHFACVVDLLGRAGYLREAFKFILHMPFQPGLTVWGSLLSACKIHRHVQMGEYAAAHLFSIDPYNTGHYVQLSNLYAVCGMWNHVHNIRNVMKEKGISKEFGYSLIEIKGKLQLFSMGDKSHPRANEIWEELANLESRLKEAGYVPDIESAIHDLSWEEMQESLCSHNERLAVAYGLIATPQGSTLRIIKNLRTCVNCHSAIKLISKIKDREIVVRDANRFHHFKDGVCSCKDYW